jgi:hypothetical protein
LGQFLAFVAAILVLRGIDRLRQFLYLRLKTNAGSASSADAVTDLQFNLTPIEVAYIQRPNDQVNLVAVQVVDLLHRSIKHKKDSPMALAEHEKVIWGRVNNYLVGLVDLEKHKKLALNEGRNIVKSPRRLVGHMNRLRSLVSQFIGKSFKELVSDPLQIRCYLSWNSIVVLIGELLKGGPVSKLQEAVRTSLSSRHLLVEERKRINYGLIFLVLGLLLFLSTMVVFYANFYQYGLLTFGVLLVGLALISGIAHALDKLPKQIPLYKQLVNLLEQMQRDNKRIQVVRFVLITLSKGFSFLKEFFKVISILFIMCVLAIVDSQSLIINSLLYFPIAYACYVAIEFAIDGITLLFNDIATLSAEADIELCRRKLSARSPLDHVKTVLQNESYDPLFSYGLAIYGIELIFLLG